MSDVQLNGTKNSTEMTAAARLNSSMRVSFCASPSLACACPKRALGGQSILVSLTWGRLRIIQYRMVKYYTQPLDAKFFALSDPTRRAVLARLAESDATVSDLAAPFAMTFCRRSRSISRCWKTPI